MLSRPILLALGLLVLGTSAALADGPQRTIVDLVREGKRDSVLAAITSPDVDVNARATDGSTALMWSIFNVDRELAQALIKAGAKVNVTSNYGATALAEAVKLEDLELVRLLLDHGADVNSPNLDNQTALMLAVNMGSLPIARLLVEHGADVNAIETFRNQNALMWAAGGNQPEIVDLLLAHGAKGLELRGHYDDWPRQMTSEPRAQFQSRQSGGLTALLYATRSGCLKCAMSLVKAGADVNHPNPDGVTPLINALDNRRFDMAMFLLDKGAKADTWDMSGRTPIYIAVDMKSFVGENGTPPPTGGIRGAFQGPDPLETRPVEASKATATTVITRLLDMGVDTNHQLTRKRPYGAGRGRFSEYDLRGGVGPLMIASMRHDHETMQALLAHGAEVDAESVFQFTPLMMAAGMSSTNRGGGAAAATADAQARAIRTIDILLDAGADVNARIADSHTHTAVIMAYVAGRDQEGRTALFAAAEGGKDKVVQHLLERGADPTVKDAAGKTALDVARTPPPAGPAGGGPPNPQAAASRAATVAMLEKASPKVEGSPGAASVR